MQTRKIFPGAFSAADTSPSRRNATGVSGVSSIRLIQHSGETERDLEKVSSPFLKIYRRRLDPIIDFKSKMFVTRSYQRLSYCGGPLPDWQGFPLLARFRLCNQSIELVLSLKTVPNGKRVQTRTRPNKQKQEPQSSNFA
jgi:hypothetical protein